MTVYRSGYDVSYVLIGLGGAIKYSKPHNKLTVTRHYQSKHQFIGDLIPSPRPTFRRLQYDFLFVHGESLGMKLGVRYVL